MQNRWQQVALQNLQSLVSDELWNGLLDQLSFCKPLNTLVQAQATFYLFQLHIHQLHPILSDIQNCYVQNEISIKKEIEVRHKPEVHKEVNHTWFPLAEVDHFE